MNEGDKGEVYARDCKSEAKCSVFCFLFILKHFSFYYYVINTNVES